MPNASRFPIRLNGLEVECRLKEMGCTVPVIMVTGDSDVSTATAALHHGAVDFLTKPIDPQELLHRLRELLTSAAVVTRTAAA